MLNLLFILLAVLFFIPVRSIPLLPVAPNNIPVYIFVIYSACNLRWLHRLSAPVLLLFAAYLAYAALDVFAFYYKGEEGVKFFGHLRVMVFAFLIVVFAWTPKYFNLVLKTITWLICLGTVWSLMIYFFGEPFQSIRMSILGAPDVYEQMKGMRLAGFTSSIFAFSYQLAPAVVISFGLYVAEQKKIWLVVFVILVLGIILNGERSSALMAALSLVLMLFFHFRRVLRLFLILSFMLLFVVVLAKIYFVDSGQQTAHYQTLFHRMDDGEHRNDLTGRLIQATAGLVTVFENPLLGGTDKKYQIVVHRLFDKIGNVTIPGGVPIPAPHNHYINIGMHAGIPGIALFLVFMFMLFKVWCSFSRNCEAIPEIKNNGIITIYAFIAVMGNALAHNHGIFFAEQTSWVLVGLICAGSLMKNTPAVEVANE